MHEQCIRVVFAAHKAKFGGMKTEINAKERFTLYFLPLSITRRNLPLVVKTMMTTPLTT